MMRSTLHSIPLADVSKVRMITNSRHDLLLLLETSRCRKGLAWVRTYSAAGRAELSAGLDRRLERL
jgi:hypothetical protein